MKWKFIVSTLVLFTIAASLAYACMVCVPCDSGGKVCAGAPSNLPPPAASCICLPEDQCVLIECTDGYFEEDCCGYFNWNIAQDEHAIPKPWPHKMRELRDKGVEIVVWRVLFSNGTQKTVFRAGPWAHTSPLEDFQGDNPRLIVKDKNDKPLKAITAFKIATE